MYDVKRKLCPHHNDNDHDEHDNEAKVSSNFQLAQVAQEDKGRHNNDAQYHDDPAAAVHQDSIVVGIDECDAASANLSDLSTSLS